MGCFMPAITSSRFVLVLVALVAAVLVGVFAPSVIIMLAAHTALLLGGVGVVYALRGRSDS